MMEERTNKATSQRRIFPDGFHKILVEMKIFQNRTNITNVIREKRVNRIPNRLTSTDTSEKTNPKPFEINIAFEQANQDTY